MTDRSSQYQALLEDVTCNLCGADDYEIVYPARYEAAQPDEIMHTFRSSGDEILVDQLVRCKKCDLQYLTPRLRAGLIVEGYSEGTDETFVSQNPARERTFARNLDLIEKRTPQRGRILDIGTAAGAFLGVAKQRGWEVAGCEPNRWMADWGREQYGIDIQPGTIFDMGLEDQSFDVVTLWDVLEHTPDPKKVLQECRRVLKPGGLLVVNYPDIEAFVSRLMGRRWVFLLSIHLYYFTVETIREMLRVSGFEMVQHRKHWQSLELGYILFRMKPYVGWASALGTKIVETLGLEHAQIPYWMGQMLVFARPAEDS
jgi:ubiquinone/menaquinone biosynthesis C-methylase UbiE